MALLLAWLPNPATAQPRPGTGPLQAVAVQGALVLPARVAAPAAAELRLREVSGLAWDARRGLWWTVSDRGLLVGWQVHFLQGRLQAQARVALPLEGQPNAESVELLPEAADANPGELAVLDEAGARWLRFDVQGRSLGATPLPAPAGVDYRRGVEALARHPRLGLVVVPQRPVKAAGKDVPDADFHTLVAEDSRQWALPVAGRGSSIKAAHADAGGRLLLLEKVADAPLARRWWLRELDLGACAGSPARCEAPAIALASPTLAEDDNLEGLACRDDGHCLAVSDDGRLPQPRTLLLWLQLQRGR
jgi:hypothetical protein